MITLDSLGWSPFFSRQLDDYLDLDPYDPDAPTRIGRISVDHGQELEVLTPHGALRAILRGRDLHDARDPTELPSTGDWVLTEDAGGTWLVTRHLERRSALLRQAAMRRTEPQLIGANIDTVLLTTSINGDLNVRRLERYLTAVWEAGATPLVVLTKADLCEDPEAVRARIEGALVGVTTVTATTLTPDGLDGLRAHLTRGRTCALVGSSGVGKSTIVNHLLGDEVQRVLPLRDDGYRGRHTTSHRELFVLPEGMGLLIDTPGMREVALWAGEAGIGQAFDDVEALIARCAFRDCHHDTEPGCAVKAALEGGDLEEGRWASYLKLQREIAFQQRKKSESRALRRKRGKKLARMVKEAKRKKYG